MQRVLGKGVWEYKQKGREKRSSPSIEKTQNQKISGNRKMLERGGERKGVVFQKTSTLQAYTCVRTPRFRREEKCGEALGGRGKSGRGRRVKTGGVKDGKGEEAR